MNHQRIFWQRKQRHAVFAALVFGLAAWSLSFSASPAWTFAAGFAEDENVATCAGDTGSILRRTGPDNKWQVVSQNEKLPAGQLLIGLPGAEANSANGAVQIHFLADLDQNSPFPIKECALTLERHAGADLGLILDRGRVDLVNRKSEGAATVHVTARKASWDFLLEGPGARVALELYGRWPAGVPFRKEADGKQEPTASLAILVLSGEVRLKHTGHEFAMHAPPGPALFEWDSVTGLDAAPQRLEKLPAWASETGEETAEAKAKKAAIERLRQRLANHPVKEDLDKLLDSDDRLERGTAIYLLAATDNLQRLGQACRETKHPDVLEIAILALRHWVGRGPGQDQILYNGLIEAGGYKPVHAETFLQLLHSFGKEELARPETYQTLIDYLDHQHLGIRALAHWHLVRLVQGGRDIAYTPLDSKEARAEAIQKWRSLVPPAKVPPRPVGENAKRQ